MAMMMLGLVGELAEATITVAELLSSGLSGSTSRNVSWNYICFRLDLCDTKRYTEEILNAFLEVLFPCTNVPGTKCFIKTRLFTRFKKDS